MIVMSLRGVSLCLKMICRLAAVVLCPIAVVLFRAEYSSNLVRFASGYTLFLSIADVLG